MADLEVQNLQYEYRPGYPIITNINLSLARGEIGCLFGTSGCGKSTIFKLIAGIIQPLTGSIAIGGKLVATNSYFVSIEDRNVGLVFQSNSLFPHLNVLKNLIFAVRKGSKAEKIARARQILVEVGMSSYESCYPHMLSGGQQQLICISRNLIQDPSLILLDEPFNSLDVVLRREIRHKVLKLIRARKISTLIITHDPEEALTMPDQLFFIRNGSIVQHGSPEEIYSCPSDHQLANFFGEINSFAGEVKYGYIECPLGRIPAKQHSCGGCSKVMVCVRPEAIKAAGCCGGLAARVVDCQAFKQLLCIKIGEQLYWMKSPASWQVKRGDSINVALDVNQVLIFDNQN